MKILSLILVALLLACASSSNEPSTDAIAKSLGVDKKELNSKSYYTFTFQDGDLSGNTMLSSSYAQTMNGFRYGGDSTLESFTVNFIDPQQGDSTFKVIFKNEVVQGFGTEEGSVFILSFLNNGEKQTLTSKSGTIQINKLIDKKAAKDDSRGSFADERRIELEFEGIFINQTSEEIKIKGLLQFVKLP